MRVNQGKGEQIDQFKGKEELNQTQGCEYKVRRMTEKPSSIEEKN